MAKKLYVGNLGYDVSTSVLQQLFSAHGIVQNVQVIMDRDTGRSKGFGFVEMSSDREARAAIDALASQSLDFDRTMTHEGNDASSSGSDASASQPVAHGTTSSHQGR